MIPLEKLDPGVDGFTGGVRSRGRGDGESAAIGGRIGGAGLELGSIPLTLAGCSEGECFVGDTPALDGGRGEALCADKGSAQPDLICGVVTSAALLAPRAAFGEVPLEGALEPGCCFDGELSFTFWSSARGGTGGRMGVVEIRTRPFALAWW